MLDQDSVTDLMIASSIGYKPDIIDIYSASWGPQDNGKSLGGPGEITKQAMLKGIEQVLR